MRQLIGPLANANNGENTTAVPLILPSLLRVPHVHAAAAHWRGFLSFYAFVLIHAFAHYACMHYTYKINQNTLVCSLLQPDVIQTELICLGDILIFITPHDSSYSLEKEP